MSPVSNLGGVQVAVIHSNCHRDHDDDSGVPTLTMMMMIIMMIEVVVMTMVVT